MFLTDDDFNPDELSEEEKELADSCKIIPVEAVNPKGIFSDSGEVTDVETERIFFMSDEVESSYSPELLYELAEEGDAARQYELGRRLFEAEPDYECDVDESLLNDHARNKEYLRKGFEEGNKWLKKSYEQGYELAVDFIDNSPDYKRMCETHLDGNLAIYKNEALYCIDNSITEIEIPEGITKIGFECFCEFEDLEKVKLPESLEVVDAMAFRACESLEVVDAMAFRACESLEKVTLPENLKKIENGAFAGCYSLVHVDMPENVEIAPEAFNGCENLDEETKRKILKK